MDKAYIVQVVLLLHLILTGIMLFRLFKLKHAQGKHVFIAIFVLMIPVIGPFSLILYFNRLYKIEQENQKRKPTFHSSPKKRKKR